MCSRLRTSLLLSLTFFLMPLLSACERQPLCIGFVGGLSGRVADLGVGGRNGALLAVEEKNARGGVNGRTVELVIRDDEQNADTARRVTRELLERKVEAIIGPMTSSMALAVTPLLNEARVVAVSPTVTTAELSGKDDYFLRVLPDTGTFAPKNARFHVRKLGLQRAALIYDTGNSSYTLNWIDSYRKTFEELGGSIVFLGSFRSAGAISFTPLIRDMLRHRPDLAVLVCSAVDAALFCQQIRKQAPNLPISVSEWGSTERFIELGGAAVEGVYFAQFLDHGNTTPRYRNFLASYRKRFGQDPGFPGLAGYDAATVVLEALQHRDQHATLKQALLNIAVYQGVQNRITLNRFGDTDSTTFITVVRNGSFITLE